jgi:hypothetical protein
MNPETGEPYNAETFDWMRYLADRVPDTRMLEYSEGRKVLTRLDPLLFGIIYGREVITGDDGSISFSDLHLELCRGALENWVFPKPLMEDRHVYVAPRGCGKSSWAFKLVPLWAAAHNHKKFIAAFSSSATQSQTHLLGFKRILDSNPLIQEDYPELCKPAKRPNGNSIADSQEMYYAESGFTIAAKGLDSGVLGLVNPNNERPDVLLMDDVEPDESNYTPYQAGKRLTTILDTVLPMNLGASVVIVGTVTMPDSIIHELVQTVVYPENQPSEWILSEKFRVHYLRPIIDKEDGTRRSIWPGKWPLEFLEEREHTRSFKKNFLNLPLATGSEYWSYEDIKYGTVDATRVLLQLDPAVTSKKTSDYSAFAVIAFEPPGARGTSEGTLETNTKARCEVRDIIAVKLPPEKLREKALQIIQKYPEIGALRIEANQGGDTWKSVFHDMPIPVAVHREHIPKDTRAMHLLNHYQRDRVFHRKHFPSLENQMLSFPNVHHDDQIDAVGAGVEYFLRPKKKASARSTTYLR